MDSENVYVPGQPKLDYDPRHKDTVFETLAKHPDRIVGLIVLVLFMVIVLFTFYILITLWNHRLIGRVGTDSRKSAKELTATQKFILAASSPTIGNRYKCVIDIWGTRESDSGPELAKELFTSSWGEFTWENVQSWVEYLSHEGYQEKFLQYCKDTENAEGEYSDFDRLIFEETRKKYPKEGMYAWDMVRILSVAGEAYMGKLMDYEEAVKIAYKACKNLQEHFQSWDDMVGSYTLGYQLWRGKRKKDRFRYYRKLKRTWIYRIPWNTPLLESEL